MSSMGWGGGGEDAPILGYPSCISDVFYTELTKYLEVAALYKCQIVISGDFNIHVENDATAFRLLELLNNFDCVQKVPQTPTHIDGGTLDLVITKSEQCLEDLTVAPPDVMSDHSLLGWRLSFLQQPPTLLDHEVGVSLTMPASGVHC